MLRALWNWIKEANTYRSSKYPTDAVTIVCACGFKSEMTREMLEASFGDRPIPDIEDDLKRQCCRRSKSNECGLYFYEIAVPSFYR